ncbi:hypothetical protein HaLaN_24875, partial [Haematococcus lacustris]
MNQDQLLTSAAQSLEQVVCKGLGVAPPAGVIRSLKLQSLKNGLNQALPEGDFNQAVQYFAHKTPHKDALESHLRRLQLRKWVQRNRMPCQQ